MRRLIVCADGTWNSDDGKPDGAGLTNVALLARAIPARGDDGIDQLLYYDEGVGTGDWWDRATGGAFGNGISKNIKDCYAFLVKMYQPGDELFFFGFSRGAYTVRSLAGIVRKCGILRRLDGATAGDKLGEKEKEAIDDAYEFYRERGDEFKPSGPRAVAWRAKHSVDVRIKCLGVWDTVGSLGIPTRGIIGHISQQKHQFHDVKLSSHVENAFHALAIDERRKPFAPSIWEIPENDPALASGTWNVEQRWFAGVHSNVGGGYEDRGLSDVALRWMVRKAQGVGLQLTEDFVASVEKGSNCKGTYYDSMSSFYKALGEHVRPIGAPRVDKETGQRMLTFEVVDDTVGERCRADDLPQRYRPGNFMPYWAQNPTMWKDVQPPAD